ncbi:hypothetical protein CSKR_114133 [Clonorchis sinensis]|uniref:Uncharacterized protein n=1 Tax=Clonorchis sinensis TaxID=79923 RepID=A0A8T1MQI0_CLOSI|nr:hypothetical protein CSKR_114133 [Clonorchis sinensis]
MPTDTPNGTLVMAPESSSCDTENPSKIRPQGRNEDKRATGRAIQSAMTDHDSLDLNGDGSEGEPGQQWTQVGRPINGRNNQRRKAKPSSPKEACYANGVHETVMRHRSFRGGKCFILPQCKPDGGPVGAARNRNLDINEVTNGHVSQTGSERLATSVSKLTISTRTDSTVNSTLSSPSPSIASETQNSSELTDDKPSYRAHGRYQRNRKIIQHSSFDVDDQSSRNSAQFRQTSPLPNSSSATNLCNLPARSSVGRMVRSPTSPSGATVTQVATFPGEPWRHSNPGWRRSHHSMPFSGRGTVPYHRSGANYQHAPRPFYGSTPRYRQPAPPVAVETSPVDSSKEAASAPVKASAIPAVSTTAVAELQSTNSEKRTSWAATVAAVPPRTEHIRIPPPPEDPSRAQLLNFLLAQWQMFNHKI